MRAMGGCKVKYETPQIKDFGSIAEHTFMPGDCKPRLLTFQQYDGCHHS